MKQAIAGVAPAELDEVTVMTVWPTLAASVPGRLIGRLCAIRTGFPPFFTLGNLFALMSIPAALALFLGSLTPGIARRYRLTNRRVVIQKQRFLSGKFDDELAVSLDKFDAIDIEVRPGQQWYPAGDLIFRHGNVETFKLVGVSRPETFRQTCLKSHESYVGVQQAIGA